VNNAVVSLALGLLALGLLAGCMARDLPRFVDARAPAGLPPPSLLTQVLEQMLETLRIDDDSAARGMIGHRLGPARPAGHDTAALVATQVPLPLVALGPLPPAACTEPDFGPGRHMAAVLDGSPSTEGESVARTTGRVADQIVPGLSKS
jgi:hypothetical protein